MKIPSFLKTVKDMIWFVQKANGILGNKFKAQCPSKGDRNPWEFFRGSTFERGFQEGIKGKDKGDGKMPLRNSRTPPRSQPLRRHNSRAKAHPEALSYVTWLSMTQFMQSQPPASTPTLAHAQVHHWGMSAPETQFEFWLNREEYPACYWKWSVSGA